MRLISWIKNTYYNHKLDNADREYQEGNISDAESIYEHILYAQPNAAVHLAKMYFEVGKSHKDELTYLGKLRELHTKTSFGKENVSSYLIRLVLHIERTADALFSNHDYPKAYEYLTAIKDDNRNNTNFAKKYSLYALYANLYVVEYKNSYETSLDFVYDYCKSDVENDVENAIVTTVQRLHKAKKLDRAFRLANCLAERDCKDAIKECVIIAYDIYNSGKDTDKGIIDENVLLGYISKNSSGNILFGLGQFAPFADKYKKRYLETSTEAIVSETDSSKASDLFKKAWQTTHDISLIQTFAKPSSNISSDVFNFFIQNIGDLNSKKNCNALFKELSNHEDYNYVLCLFEKFHKKGIDVRKEYITKAKSIYEYLGENEKLSLVNRVLRIYNDDQWTLNEKIALAERCQARKDYKNALLLYSELVGLHADAQPRIAQLYLEQSQNENNLLKKRKLVSKACEFKKSHNYIFNTKIYGRVLTHLSSEVLNIIHLCFKTDIPEEAYVTANIFKSYFSCCYKRYIKELKTYKDKDYVLAKLVALHNENSDVENDYKEVVNKIYADKNCDNRYKLKVLYKAYKLLGDTELYNKFVSKGVETINAENEETQAVSCFSEIWSLIPDLALLNRFVTEEYKHHKAIIEFLIEKSQISKWEKHIFSHFCDKVSALGDYKYALSIFERLNAKRLSVQKPYVATVIKALPKLDTDTKLSLINKSLTIFQDKYLIDEKLSIANVYLSEGNYEKSENTLKELVGLHTSAEPQLAILYYEEAKNTRSLDNKENFILKGLAFYSKHSSIFSVKEYDAIFKKLLRAYNTLIEKYCSTNDFDNAYRLCLGLKTFSKDWFDKYANIKLHALLQIKNNDSKIKEIRTFFKTLESDGISLKTVNTENIYCLWDELNSAQIKFAHTLPYTECTVVLNDFVSYVEIHCEKDKSDSIVKNVKTELAALHKKEGYKYEQECKYFEAINAYNALYGIADTRTRAWCKIRNLICLIKQDKNIVEDDVRKSLGYVGFAKEKKDLSYRYGIWLIKHRDIKESSRFINEFLSNESELVDFCKGFYIKEAEKALADLNRKISRLKTGEATLREAQDLANNLNNYDLQISTYLPDTHSRIETIRTSILSYILSKCFEEGDYKQAMILLKESGKNWYEDDIFFRNVAIACLGMTETDKINRTNYKLIISYWLTAVYRDQLFVSSLDHTSWDDPYTFTLENSLGGSKADAFDSLPENVNFDDPIDGSVISIAEVQQNLLSRFELALNNKDKDFVSFYEEQKDAMDSLVKLNMDNPCIIAAPYLANNTSKCKIEIKKTLDYEYENYENENILKVGVLYNINTGNYKKYKDASNYAEKCMTAAKSMSDIDVRNVFTSDIMDTIREFTGLYESFSTKIQNVLTNVTKNDRTSYKTVLNVFSIICEAVHDNTLSYIFGNFINQSVANKINDNSLDLASGLNDLVTAYQVAKSCTQLKNNIGNALEALVGKYITEANSFDLTTIKTVLKSTGTEFEGNVAKTLGEQLVLLAIATGHADAIKSLASIQAKSTTLKTKLDSLKSKIKEISVNMELSNIVEKVNNKTLAYYSALQKVYNIYKVNQNNSRVCDNLCTLIGMCIREYVIPDKYEKDKVMAIFNELKNNNNKSATYKTSAQTLREERQKILNQLPFEARTLLTGGTSFGSTLNAEGIKLKNALQLYLDLA